MNYKHIWVIESKPIDGKGSWNPVELKWFDTRKMAKAYIARSPWLQSTNEYWKHRISKYMGPIKSGCIREEER